MEVSIALKDHEIVLVLVDPDHGERPCPHRSPIETQPGTQKSAAEKMLGHYLVTYSGNGPSVALVQSETNRLFIYYLDVAKDLQDVPIAIAIARIHVYVK